MRRQSGCCGSRLNRRHRRGMSEVQARQACPTPYRTPSPLHPDRVTILGALLCPTRLCIAWMATAATVGQSGSSICVANLPEEHGEKLRPLLLFLFADRPPVVVPKPCLMTVSQTCLLKLVQATVKGRQRGEGVYFSLVLSYSLLGKKCREGVFPSFEILFVRRS